ncbi:MAG: alpha/beta hydrolase [Thermoplasmata archaeon]
MPKRWVNGVELSYDVHGNRGDPAVLVHGSLQDRHLWDRTVSGLSTMMEVVAYDRRGHGASGMAPRAHPVRDDAADLAGLLEGLDLYPAHVIAHSYGGAVALRLAIDRPEMVRSLAIHEPPLIGMLTDDPATAAEAERLLAGVRLLQQQIRSGQRALAVEQIVDTFSTEPGAWGRLPEPVRASMVLGADRWAEELDDPEAVVPDRGASRELMVPTLLTYGSRSPPFLRRIVHDLGDLLHNVHLVEISDAGHVPQLTRPDQYVGLLVTFLLERNVPGT